MTRLQASLLSAVLIAACSKDSASGADAGAKADAGQKPDGGQSATPQVSGPVAAADGTSLGQLAATEHINLNAIVNKTPEQVDAALGEPEHTGTDRVSCVRFVPERVFFECKQEIRAYEHPSFSQIRVEFEDGRAAMVAISGLPGVGEFDPDAALALVGIKVPDAPFHDNPPLVGPGPQEEGAVVDRWEWGNSKARLRVDELEHRVRLSVVNGDWKRAKVEVINNNPLTPEQEARIKQPRGAEGGASTPAVSDSSAPE